MAQYLDLEKDRLVFDLVWERMDAASRGSIAAHAGGAQFAVAVGSKDSGHAVGYLHDSQDKKARKRLVSFAAVVAKTLPAPQDKALLLFIELEGNEAILVGIRAGLPVPDFDRYGHRQDLMGAAYEFIRDNPEVRIVGNTSEFPQCEPFSLEQFLGDKTTKKAFRAATLKKIGGSSRTPILLAVTILFGLFVAYDTYDTKKRREEEQAAPPPVDPAVTYQNALPAAIASEGMTVQDATALLDRAKTLEVSAAGWHAGQVKCTSMGCDLTWSRQSKAATVGDLFGAIGRDSSKLVNEQTIVQHVAYKSTPAKLDMSMLRTEQDILIGMLDPLQRLGDKVSLGVTLANKFAAGGVTPPTAISRGELRIQGPLWLMDSIKSIPRQALIREFTMSAGAQGATFNATVIYFAK